MKLTFTVISATLGAAEKERAAGERTARLIVLANIFPCPLATASEYKVVPPSFAPLYALGRNAPEMHPVTTV